MEDDIANLTLEKNLEDDIKNITIVEATDEWTQFRLNMAIDMFIIWQSS